MLTNSGVRAVRHTQDDDCALEPDRERKSPVGGRSPPATRWRRAKGHDASSVTDLRTLGARHPRSSAVALTEVGLPTTAGH
jgi:hypothetical protein